MKKAITIIIFSLLLYSCTENERAKDWGGHSELVLEPNQKLVTATWKEANLWYLTRPMTISDSPEIYHFKEESSYGILIGSYTIKEVKTIYPPKIDTPTKGIRIQMQPSKEISTGIDSITVPGSIMQPNP